MAHESTRSILALVCGTVCYIFCSFLSSAEAQDRFRVVGAGPGELVQVRPRPEVEAPVSGSIPANSSDVLRIGECETWCLVRHDNLVGWVERKFLFAIEPDQNALADCNGEPVDRRLAGCTELIKQGALAYEGVAIALSRRADAYLEMLNVEAAIADLASALQSQPDDKTYRRRLSQAYALRAATLDTKLEPQQSLENYAQAIKIDPANHEAYFGRSSVRVKLGEISNAVEDLKKAFELDRGSDLYRIRLGRLHEAGAVEHVLRKEVDPAISEYTEAITLLPADATLRLSRGDLYASKNLLNEAINDYDEAIRFDPKYSEARLRRGELLRGRNAASAIDDFSEVLKQQPRNVTALLLRAVSQEAIGGLEAAKADYRSILQIEPSNSMAKQSLLRMGSPPAGLPNSLPTAADTKAIAPDHKAPPKQAKTQPAIFGAEKREPPYGSVLWGKTVLVDDGTCPQGQIKEITGGNTRHGIPRQRRCVRR